MTTTDTPTADQLGELDAAKVQRDAAVAERERIDGEYREWDDGIRSDEAELNHLARTEPAQFVAGQPRPKTRAATLRKQIDVAKNANWRDIIAGADERLAQREREVRRLTSNNAVTLARRE